MEGMENNNPMPQEVSSENAAPQEPVETVPMPPAVATLAVRFTGTGSEYFRIWIVNLLLTLVTLTLYLPFARARRMAYFQNNTLVGNDPLGFHADPWKMFRGYLLVLVLGLGYWSVTHFMPSLNWLALLVFALVWPALWRASLQFRLRNTSWRGVRLGFTGDLRGAYVAMLPAFLPALFFAAFMPQVEPGDDMAEEVATQVLWVMAGGMLLMLVAGPWMWAQIKRYQHQGYSFLAERTRFDATNKQFYVLSAKVIGVSMLVMAGMGSVMASVGVAMTMLGTFGAGDMSDPEKAAGFGTVLIVVVAAMTALIYILWPLIVGSYTTSRQQNMVWNHTHSPNIRFHSDLKLAPLLRLNALNWVLIAVTAGLYWPFAKVRSARIRLEAMRLEVQGNVDDWVADAAPGAAGTVGDAAGDFFGIDLGL